MKLISYGLATLPLGAMGISGQNDFADVIQDLTNLPADKSFSSRGMSLDARSISSEKRISQAKEGLIVRLVQYTAAAYCADFVIKAWSCSFCRSLQNVELISVQDDFWNGQKGYVAVDHTLSAIVVVFRGSSDIQNWVSDFDMAKTSFDIGVPNIKVHHGFLQYSNGITPKTIPVVQPLIAKYTNYTLIITGHSLGAAVASIASIQLQKALNIPWFNITLVTFGQPRVGNLPFAQWMNSRNTTMLRVVNNRDIVPHVPPYNDGYVHHNREILLTPGLTQSCTSTSPEDPNCANSKVPYLDALDHISYLDVNFTLLC
ncbi:hypothetical protein DSO57_1035467 [Entomophthora muscae]|uniref:Uncharacterized protein n=1 Tax=Entomophthora muscae TaxID=34485 RepID=A0ACC2TAU1_9FUNG|nr:hypothetical protein DSO57_1035467 [Entomophthora muscae]